MCLLQLDSTHAPRHHALPLALAFSAAQTRDRGGAPLSVERGCLADCGGAGEPPCEGGVCFDTPSGTRLGVNGANVCRPCGAMGGPRCQSALLPAPVLPVGSLVGASRNVGSLDYMWHCIALFMSLLALLASTAARRTVGLQSWVASLCSLLETLVRCLDSFQAEGPETVMSHGVRSSTFESFRSTYCEI